MTLSQMKYYKQKFGYSFAQLSELSGVPVGTIQKIFRGETKSPRYDTLMALEKVLRPDDDRICETAVVYDDEKPFYTLDDYYALPDERRVELIDGKFYDMAAPASVHQLAITELSFHILSFIRSRGGDCVPFVVPTDVQLDQDQYTMVQPDIFVVCDKEKVTYRCIAGAPDWVIEILSDSTRNKDAFLKLHKYQNAGVREYWMVDLKKRRVVVYFFDEDEIPMIYGSEDKIPVRIYDGELVIPFGEIVKAVGEFPAE